MAQAIETLAGETILKELKGDCWSTPQSIFSSQVSGRYIFTNQRIVFRGGGLIEKLRLNFEIPVSEIDKLEPYTVGPFIPTGIRVRMKDGGIYKLSVLHRNAIIELIEDQLH